jgi:putative redox protein
MVKVKAIYQGEKHCQVEHGPSQSVLETDAPLDNNGRGERFSPTDLVAAALSTCTLTVMSIVAERDGVDLTGTTAEVEKHMTTNPRRIEKLITRITFPEGIPVEFRKKLENTARTCPVHHSLREDIEAPIEFIYPEE